MPTKLRRPATRSPSWAPSAQRANYGKVYHVVVSFKTQGRSIPIRHTIQILRDACSA
ncbi:MAG: hypothetical protein QMC24_00720 [Akkermansiaceae bacterium]